MISVLFPSPLLSVYFLGSLLAFTVFFYSLFMSSWSTTMADPKSENSVNIELSEEAFLQCMIRLPLSHHFLLPNLSKNLNLLVKSGTIFEERARCNIKEASILVGINSSSVHQRVKWYSITKRGSRNEYGLQPVNFPSIPGEQSPWVGALNRAFSFGARGEDNQSTNKVICVVCGSNKVGEVQNTKAIHLNPAKAVVGNSLYIFGGENIDDDANFLEVFNIKKNTWDSVSLPEEYIKDIGSSWRTAAMVLSNRIHLFNRRGNTCLVFDPETGMIERRDQESVGSILFDSSCVINDTIFSIRSSLVIEAFDWTAKTWRIVRGLENQPEWDILTTGLLSYHDNLLVLHQPRPEQICITVIGLEKRGIEMWGHILSTNTALILQRPATIVEVVNVEI